MSTLQVSYTRARLDIPEATCTVCAKPFIRFNTMQIVCGVSCARRVPVINRKAEKAETRKRKEAIKPRSKWVNEAQEAVNAYVRKRDEGKPCICCGRFSQGAGSVRGGEWDAGHYRSRGAAPELRFDERNIHSQLKQCNRRAWDVAGYRANLVLRIGIDEVVALEGPHAPKKYTVEDLKAIIALYRGKLKELQG